MIAVIGSNMVDLITYTDIMPKAGETLEAGRFAMGCGGKGANQAVASAKLGAKVTMVSKVGDDAFADNTIANFQSFGIDTKHVSKEPGYSSGVAPIFVDSNSQNRILIIKGANSRLFPQDIDEAAEDLKQCRLIVLQLEIPLETVYYAIDFGNQHNIPVLLNPAPASKELDIDYACRCDFFVPNETELEILTGLPVQTEEEIILAAETLLSKGLKNIIVTMGSRGVLWMDGKNCEMIRSHQVDAIDTSGAGDAFIGCFAARFVDSGDIRSALLEANAYAACSVTACGTQTSYPDTTRFTEMRKQFEK